MFVYVQVVTQHCDYRLSLELNPNCLLTKPACDSYTLDSLAMQDSA